MVEIDAALLAAAAVFEDLDASSLWAFTALNENRADPGTPLPPY